MERLTTRLTDVAVVPSEYAIGKGRYAADVIQEMAERLAAYEDTGLTPEEVAALKEESAQPITRTAGREYLKLHQLNKLENTPVWAEGPTLGGTTIGEWMICDNGTLTTTTGARLLAADAIKNCVLFYTGPEQERKAP